MKNYKHVILRKNNIRNYFLKWILKSNIYLLNDWFRDPLYKDVLDYIISVNCQYYFECIPLAKLGLPVLLNKEGELEWREISQIGLVLL